MKLNKSEIFIKLFIFILLICVVKNKAVDVEINGKTITYYTENSITEDTNIVKDLNGLKLTTNEKNVVLFLVINSELTFNVDTTIKIIKNESKRILKGKNPKSILRYLQEEDDEYTDIDDEYGIRSAIVLIGKKAKLNLENNAKLYIETNCKGCKAITFLNNCDINLYDTEIKTIQDNSDGLYINNAKVTTDQIFNISTYGDFSPAINIKNGTINSNELGLYTTGNNSPLIFSSDKVEIKNSYGNSKSQIAIFKGKNNILLDNCNFSFEGKNNNQNNGIMIYDNTNIEEEKICDLKIINTNFIVNNTNSDTNIFYVSNTIAIITIINLEVKNNTSLNILNAKGNSLKDDYSYGAEVAFRIMEKEISGKFMADENSIINIELNELDSSKIITEGEVYIQ